MNTQINEAVEQKWNPLCKEHHAFCEWVNSFHPEAAKHLTSWNGFQAGWQARAALPPPIVEPVACGSCSGTGWVPLDPDIGTDQECSSCGGSGESESDAETPAAASVPSDGAADARDAEVDPLEQARRDGWSEGMQEAQELLKSEISDAARLDFMAQHEAWVAWSKDGESCRVFHRNEDGEPMPMIGWGARHWSHDPREAIDAARLSGDTAAQGGE